VAYVACLGNGAEAARRCGAWKGGDPNDARFVARNIMRNEDVLDRIDELAGEKMRAVHITAEQVLGELHRIAHINPRDAFDPVTNDLLPLHAMPEDVQRAISSVKIEALYEGAGKQRRQIGYTKEVKFWTKTQALEMLARTLALFKDSLQLKDEREENLDENARAARAASLFELARQRRDRGDDLV
jgi:phage terminase small subunit